MKIKYTTVQVGTTVCSYSLPPKHWQLVATTKPYNLGCTEPLHSGFSILWWNFIREKLFNRENQICFLKKKPPLCMKTHHGWLRNEPEGPLAFCASTVYRMLQWLLCLLFTVVAPKWFPSLNLMTCFKMKKPIAEESSAHFWVDLRISSASVDSDSMAWSIFPTLTLLKMSFPSIAFYSLHGGHFLVGPPHHHKQHA